MSAPLCKQTPSLFPASHDKPHLFKNNSSYWHSPTQKLLAGKKYEEEHSVSMITNYRTAVEYHTWNLGLVAEPARDRHRDHAIGPRRSLELIGWTVPLGSGMLLIPCTCLKSCLQKNTENLSPTSKPALLSNFKTPTLHSQTNACHYAKLLWDHDLFYFQCAALQPHTLATRISFGITPYCSWKRSALCGWVPGDSMCTLCLCFAGAVGRGMSCLHASTRLST